MCIRDRLTATVSVSFLNSIIAILFVVISIYQKNSSLLIPTKSKGIFWSSAAGYTSFLIHAGGPPLNFYLLPQKMHKTIYVGTFTLAFTIINAVKTTRRVLVLKLRFEEENTLGIIIKIMNGFTIPPDK